MANAQVLTETDLFRSYWDDGLLDLLCGLGLLTTGLGWIGGLDAFAVLLVPLWITLWSPLRRKIVEPRAGYVRFSLSRQESTARDLRWTLALGVGVFALLVIGAWGLQERQPQPLLQLLAPGIPALLLALGAGLTGMLTGARRFQAYGLALVAAALAICFVIREPALPLIVVGGIVTVSGANLLVRFVRAGDRYREAA